MSNDDIVISTSLRVGELEGDVHALQVQQAATQASVDQLRVEVSSGFDKIGKSLDRMQSREIAQLNESAQRPIWQYITGSFAILAAILGGSFAIGKVMISPVEQQVGTLERSMTTGMENLARHLGEIEVRHTSRLQDFIRVTTSQQTEAFKDRAQRGTWKGTVAGSIAEGERDRTWIRNAVVTMQQRIEEVQDEAANKFGQVDYETYVRPELLDLRNKVASVQLQLNGADRFRRSDYNKAHEEWSDRFTRLDEWRYEHEKGTSALNSRQSAELAELYRKLSAIEKILGGVANRLRAREAERHTDPGTEK